MLAVFCLRLAAGMLACLLLLPAVQVHPRFYRTHFLTALGLTLVAVWAAWQTAPASALICIAIGTGVAFVSVIVWSVEGAPGGKLLVVLTVAALASGLVILERHPPPPPEDVYTAAPPGLASLLVGDVTSALLLGAAMSAMLMGHSYLIAPGMSMTPLLRLLAAFAIGVGLRLAVDGFGLWHWSATHRFASLGNDELLWLPLRWLVGFVLPLVLGWMAWQTARIRSTQSATGILYVVVIFCFLGELTALLLRDRGVTL
jgi:hypothetical protein